MLVHEDITKFLHFRFSKVIPRKMEMKHHCNSENVETFPITTDANKAFAATDLPSVFLASGLSRACQKYLQDNCTVFCRPENQEAFGAMLE